MFKKIIILYSIAVTIAIISFFAGKITTEQRLVEQHRLELDAARERAAVLTDTLERARTEVGEIGASLDKQRTSVSELRELLTEVRARYEKMENLLNNTGLDDSDIWADYSSAAITNEEQVGEEY